MSTTPKTIQIFLPSGDPRGIRIAEITTRIVQVIEVPRSLLADFLAMQESTQVAVYFLFGEATNDIGVPSVYIGQTGDLRSRLVTHQQKKDFWTRALVWISRTNSLTQTHALFLEWHCLQATKRAARYGNENGNAGTKPHTPAPLEADCLEIFETGRTLLATLGFPVFEALGGGDSTDAPAVEFNLTVRNASGRGVYTSEGFVILKDSIGFRNNVVNFSESNKRFRQQLIKSGVIRVEGDKVRFLRDHVFGSPSMAALALLGRTSNGWREWKTADGRTLHEVFRTSADVE